MSASVNGDETNIVAVTGATGFIGSQVLSLLDEEGLPTRALIRHKRNRTLTLPASTEVVSGSLHDPQAIGKLLQGARTCIHAAGATKSIGKTEFQKTNVVGTRNIATCAAEAGVEHFIYISSQAARAPDISDYAASKAESETALLALQAKMKVSIIRPPAVIGPGDPMLQPMFDLIRAGWLPAPSDPAHGRRRFAVISIRDLADYIVMTARSSEAAADILEPCSIPATDWKEVAEIASNVLDRKVRLLPIWPRLMQGAAYLADGLAAVSRRPLSLSSNKVRELLAVDWTYDHAVSNAMSLREIFEECLLEN